MVRATGTFCEKCPGLNSLTRSELKTTLCELEVGRLVHTVICLAHVVHRLVHTTRRLVHAVSRLFNANNY